MRKHIAELISQVLDEETEIITSDGKIDKGTVEEALIRVTVKRAMDPKSRLGMEAQRFLTEYVYGKPVQPTAVAFRNVTEYDTLDTDVLYQRQMELLQGAMNGDFKESPVDPTRVLEDHRRVEVIQGILDTRGDVRAEGAEASAARREERAAEKDERITTPAERLDDELLKGMWDL